jgi:preprotein translocase subunit SecA
MERDRDKSKTSGLAARLQTAINRFRGVSVETDLAVYWKMVEEIHAHRRDGRLDRQSEAGLREHALGLAARVKQGLSPAPAAVEMFALVYEASCRALGLFPHDVQLIAALAMAEGKIAELPTGEGKTLAAVFPASLFALTGRGVHVLTFNDYLARRDAAWMLPVYRLLGLSVGFIQEGMSKGRKREAYLCDVTYATAKEAGFDFLRDRLALDQDDCVHRPFHFALVDEADSILVDEARIPLVISGISGREEPFAQRLAPLVRSLRAGQDYRTDEENRNVFLTDEGLEKVEGLLRSGNLYAPENERLLSAVNCALHAEALLKRDVDYIVRNDRVEIVDEFTGRVMDKRHWPDGLQAAVEAKENLARRSEGRILGLITLQHYLRLYPRLCGMTATARPSAAELKEFYDLGVVVVPPHRPCVRVDHPDRVFTHGSAKTAALVREISEVHATGRPILVGTLSVKESEELAAALEKAGISCEVLNAKNDELEAKIIAGAGRAGAVTISTNMAGRGTDIRLGGPGEEDRDRVVGLGGLYVIGTNRHESLRIDQQLRGRAGRQGDPGASRFFISLEDDIFESYGLRNMFFERHHLKKDAKALDNDALRREIGHAQKIIEGRNFDIRKSLWKFSSLIETQRKIVQMWREQALSPGNGDPPLFPLSPTLIEKGTARFGRDHFDLLRKRSTALHIDRLWADHLAWLADFRESVHLVSLGGREPLNEFRKEATQAFLGMEKNIGQAVAETLEDLLRREGPVDLEAEGFKGPSSTWTYLVNEEQFGWGVEILKGKNIGFSVIAASYAAPLFLLTLLVKRIFGRRR